MSVIHTIFVFANTDHGRHQIDTAVVTSRTACLLVIFGIKYNTVTNINRLHVLLN